MVHMQGKIELCFGREARRNLEHINQTSWLAQNLFNAITCASIDYLGWRGDSMRIGIGILSIVILVGCQSTAHHECSREGHVEGTPEFRECVTAWRKRESKRLNKEIGQPLDQQRMGR